MADKKFPFLRKRLFINWVLSYVSILLIPVIISGIVHGIAIKIVEREVERTNSGMLKQLQQGIDSQLMDVERLGIQVTMNKRLQSLMNEARLYKQLDTYSMIELQRDFQLYKFANSFITNLYVYIKNEKMGIAANTFSDSKMFHNIVHGDHSIAFEEWLRMMNGTYIRNYIPLLGENSDEKTGRTVAYAQSIPMEFPNQSTGTLIILMDGLRLEHAIQNVKLVNQGMVFIIDKNDNILFSTQPVTIDKELKYAALTDQDGLFYTNLGSESVAVSFIASGVTDWKYVTIVPADIFSEKVKYIRTVTIASILICLVLGGIIAYIFARRNYNPVNELVRILAGNANISLDQGYNEYRFIREAISSTLSEKEKINRLLSQQNVVLKTNFLARLLKGRIEDHAVLDETLASYGVNFRSDTFAVILFYIEDYNQLFLEESLGQADNKLKLVHFIIANVVEELTARKHSGYVVEVDEMPVCLVNLKGEQTEQYMVSLLEIASEAKMFLEEKFRVHLTIAVSHVHETYGGIYEAYHEALEAMEYRAIKGINRIIPYEEVKALKSKGRGYRYSIESEQKLINYIKTGEFAKASGLVEDIFEVNFSGGTLSIQLAKCLMSNLAGTVIKTIDELGEACDPKFIEQLNLIEEILGCSSTEEMKEKIKEILFKVCEYSNSRKKDSTHKLRDSMIAFIHSHYHDENLSLSMLTDEFDMNAKYLSTFFKEQLGEGFVDYVGKIRLNKAKELIKNEELNISDIAKRVGYYNSNALIRAFKKYEGVTPGKLRNVE